MRENCISAPSLFLSDKSQRAAFVGVLKDTTHIKTETPPSVAGVFRSGGMEPCCGALARPSAPKRNAKPPFRRGKQSACQPLAVRHKAALAAFWAVAQTHLKSRALLRKRCYRLTAARLREGTSSLSTSPSALRGGYKQGGI